MLEPAWCQSTIFPFTTRKIAVACWPGPSQRLCCRSPSTKVARAVWPWLLIETIRPEHGSAEFQASACGVRAQPDDARALHDLGARREQVGRALVVVRVQRLAPRADDALGRRRAIAAAGRQHCEQRAEQQGRLQASASRTSDWKCASSRSLSGSSRPFVEQPGANAGLHRLDQRAVLEPDLVVEGEQLLDLGVRDLLGEEVVEEAASCAPARAARPARRRGSAGRAARRPSSPARASGTALRPARRRCGSGRTGSSRARASRACRRRARRRRPG